MMNSFILCITLLLSSCAFAVSINDGTNGQNVDGRVCMPGASYFDGCNTVTCLPNHDVIRTKKACFELDSNGQQVSVPELEAPEDFWQKTETKKRDRICKPGASYFDGCNTVSCGPNNVQYQTLVGCGTLDANGKWHTKPVLEAPEDFWLKE